MALPVPSDGRAAMPVTRRGFEYKVHVTLGGYDGTDELLFVIDHQFEVFIRQLNFRARRHRLCAAEGQGKMIVR
jgi:hypothetical protein